MNEKEDMGSMDMFVVGGKLLGFWFGFIIGCQEEGGLQVWEGGWVCVGGFDGLG